MQKPELSDTAPLAAGRADPGHIPALDGIRGLAILLVMATHFTLIKQGITIDRVLGAAGRFGWSGVDLFFVLSGFLITGILLENKGREGYFSSFYARRALRIFPLYYLIIFAGTFLLPLLPLSRHENFRPVSGATTPLYWLYLSNLPVAFTAEADNDLLGITWSLAIEEQFYIVWPMVVLLSSTRTLKRICIGLVAPALVTRAALVAGGAERIVVYVLTPCRMDAIAVGSFIAILFRERGRTAGLRALMPRVRWIAAAMAILLLAIIAWHRTTGFIGGPGQTAGYTVVAVLYGCLLVAAVAGTGRGGAVHWCLTRSWLLMLGRYSYALYLFHMPIRTLIRDYVYGPAQFHRVAGSEIPGQLLFYVLCFVPSMALAWLSWHLIERRFLALKRYFPTKRTGMEAAAWEGAESAKPSVATLG